MLWFGMESPKNFNQMLEKRGYSQNAIKKLWKWYDFNLLHTVSISEEVYRQLLEIRVWDEVLITGREIRVIGAYYESGDFAGEWRDTGCNTLLVESVSIVDGEIGD